MIHCSFQRILSRWYAIVALILIVCGLLLPLPHGWSAGWRGELLNRLHAPMAFVFTLAVAWLMPRRGRFAMLIVFVLSAGTLAVTEMLQTWFGRTASWTDLGWTLVGVLAGCIGLAAMSCLLRLPRLTGLFLAMLAALSPPGWWSWIVLQARIAANEQLPVLLAPRTHASDFFWQPCPASSSATRLILDGNEETTISVRLDAGGQDWSGFDGIEIQGELQNSTGLVEIGVRVDLVDATQTRLHASLWMRPETGVAQAWWPAGKKAHIAGQLVLFLSQETRSARLLLNRVTLIKSTKLPNAPHFSSMRHN